MVKNVYDTKWVQAGWTLGSTEAKTGDPSEGEILDALQGIERQNLLAVITRINCSLFNGGLYDPTYQSWLCSEFLRPGWRQRIANSVRDNGLGDRPITIFAPSSLRRLMMTILRQPLWSGGLQLSDRNTRFKVGRILLSFNSTHAPKIPLLRASELYPLQLAIFLERSAYQDSIELSSMMTLHNWYMKCLTGSQLFTARFDSHTGCSPNTYLAGQALIFSWFSQIDPMWVRASGPSYLDLRYAFGKARISKNVALSILRTSSIDLSGAQCSPIGSLLRPGIPAEIDVGPLIRRPLGLVANNSLMCFDLEFLHWWFSRGIHNVFLADKTESQSFLDAKGIWFESFCAEVFRRIAHIRQATWIPPGVHGIDGIYQEGDRAIFVESKCSFVSNQSKFADDAKVLLQELEQKIITGSDGAKGVAQLVRAISDDLGKKVAHSTNAKQIKPLLVTEDPFLSKLPTRGFIVERALNQNSHGTVVRALEVISYEDLLMMLDRSLDYSPFEVLLGLEVNQKYLSHKNAMIDEFPIRTNADESLLRMPTDFSDQAFAQLRENYQAHDAPPCKLCSRPLTNWEYSGEQVWHCRYCNKVDRRLTETERASMAEDYRLAVSWFEESE